jgi:hypothetical protein
LRSFCHERKRLTHLIIPGDREIIRQKREFLVRLT